MSPPHPVSLPERERHIDPARGALGRLLRAMSDTATGMQAASDDLERDIADAKMAIERNLLVEHFGHRPERPLAWTAAPIPYAETGGLAEREAGRSSGSARARRQRHSTRNATRTVTVPSAA